MKIASIRCYTCVPESLKSRSGAKTFVHPGDCAFMRQDNRLWLQKKAAAGKPYHSVVLKFTRAFLRDFYQRLDRQKFPLTPNEKR